MTKSRTEVTIERHRVITIRNASSIEAIRCPRCGGDSFDLCLRTKGETGTPEYLLEEMTLTKGEEKP